MRQFTTEGIIIKRKNYGEADRLITLYTRKHGKIQVKATGVRKITSRRSPHVELLNYSVIQVHKGRTYPVLTEAEVIEDFSGIKNDLEKVGFAYHLCELIDGLCPDGQIHEAVFDLLKTTLDRLAADKNSYEIDITSTNEAGSTLKDSSPVKADQNDILDIIHDFEVELLTLLGFWHGTQEMSARLDTNDFIENLIERRLKSRRIFSKI